MIIVSSLIAYISAKGDASTFAYFLGLSWQVVLFITRLWPITLALTLIFGASVVATMRRTGPSLTADRLPWLFLPFVTAPLLVLLGTILVHDRSQDPAPIVNTVLLDAALIAHVVYCTWIVWTLAGYRWLAANCVTLASWIAIPAALVASMSIRGTWL
jgi:hypothetical protein